MTVNIIRAEIIKIRRAHVPALIVAFPAFAVTAISLLTMVYSPSTGWTLLTTLLLKVWAIFMFPLSSLTLAAAVCQVEHSSRGWLYVLSLPISRYKLYSIKMSIVYACVICATFLLPLVLLLAGYARGLLGHQIIGHPDFHTLIVTPGRIVLGGLWIVAIQLWLSLRFQSIVPLVSVSAALLFVEIAGIIAAPLIGPAQSWMMFIPSITAYAASSNEPAWQGGIWVGLIGGIATFAASIAHLVRREL